MTKQHALDLLTGICIIGAILLIGLALDAILTQWGVYEFINYWVQHIFGA